MPRSNTRPSRTGIRATRRGGAASITSSTSAATAVAAIPRFPDPGRDRLGHHLEISELHPARRQFAWRVLFDRHLERLSAGRQRHQDDPSRAQHLEPHHLQGMAAGHSNNTYRGLVSAHLQGDQRPQFHPMRPLLIGDRCGAIPCPISRRRPRRRISSTRRRPRKSPRT